MLTPRFRLEQDDKFVTVYIYAPFTNVSETEVFMDSQDFRFFSKPYFLRLHFPGTIEENDEASARYDADSLSFVIKCPKSCHGEFFPNLDMISELCKPPGGQNVQLIEELETEESDKDWYFEQIVPSDKDKDFEDGFGIGFGSTFTNVFERLLTECQEVLDVKNPGQLSLKQRSEQQLELEAKHFNADHYLCDFFEPDEILTDAILNYKFPIDTFKNFSDDDRVKLIDMSKVKLKSKEPEESETEFKSCRLNSQTGSKFKLRTLCAINELIFAYCYDMRTNTGEHNSESAWTIAKLSSSLVCSTVKKTLKESVVGSFRRALIYPIYRNFELCLKVLNDVASIWTQESGKVHIVKILLDIIALFNESEGRYIFNQLYLNQYVLWVQSIKSEKIAQFGQNLVELEILKDDVKLDLNELENAGKLVQEEAKDDALISGMEKLCANEDDSDDYTSDSEDSSSEDSIDTNEEDET